MIQFFIFSKYRTNAETTKNNNILITNAPILLCYVGTCIRIYGAIFDTDSGKECEKAKKIEAATISWVAHFLLFSYLFTCIGTFKFVKEDQNGMRYCTEGIFKEDFRKKKSGNWRLIDDKNVVLSWQILIS